jgi:hypothetical protein
LESFQQVLVGKEISGLWHFFSFRNSQDKKRKITFARKNFCKMADDSFFLIDIEKILKEKLGAKYKFVPGFLVSYLKRIVHQDELNVFLRESKGKVGVEFLENIFRSFQQPVENLPKALWERLGKVEDRCLIKAKKGRMEGQLSQKEQKMRDFYP